MSTKIRFTSKYFKDIEKRQLLLWLYFIKNWSIKSLEIYFKVPRAFIAPVLRVHAIDAKEQNKRKFNRLKKINFTEDAVEGKVSVGKSYKEYLFVDEYKNKSK